MEDVAKTNNPLQWKKYNMVSIGNYYWTFVWGIMTVPLDHYDAKSPLLNLRVVLESEMMPTEDLKHPLISHCGGLVRPMIVIRLFGIAYRKKLILEFFSGA